MTGTGRPMTPATERLKIAQAQKVERENLVAAGKLVDAEEMQGQYADIIVAARSRLPQLPARARGAFPGQPQFATWLEQELIDALNILAEDSL